MIRSGVRVVTGFGLCLSLIGTANAQTGCWQTLEIRAAQVRDLQSLLMVGSLNCSKAGYDFFQSYNQFVARNRDVIAGYNRLLKARFMRDHGVSEGQRAYDSFTTSLVNRHSAQAHASAASFCETIAAVAQLASSAEVPDVILLAENFTERPAGIGQNCATPTQQPPIVSTAPQEQGDQAEPVVTATPDGAVIVPPGAAEPAAEQPTSQQPLVQPQSSADPGEAEVTSPMPPNISATTPITMPEETPR